MHKDYQVQNVSDNGPNPARLTHTSNHSDYTEESKIWLSVRISLALRVFPQP